MCTASSDLLALTDIVDLGKMVQSKTKLMECNKHSSAWNFCDKTYNAELNCMQIM